MGIRPWLLNYWWLVELSKLFKHGSVCVRLCDAQACCSSLIQWRKNFVMPPLRIFANLPPKIFCHPTPIKFWVTQSPKIFWHDIAQIYFCHPSTKNCSHPTPTPSTLKIAETIHHNRLTHLCVASLKQLRQLYENNRTSGPKPFTALLPAEPRTTSAAILNNLGDAREVKARTAKIIRAATSAMKIRQIVACTTLNQSEMKHKSS